MKLIVAAVAAPSELPLDPVLLPDPGGLAPKWWLGAALLLAATVAVLLRGVARVWASGDEFSLAARIAFALVAWAVALVGAVLLSLALPATTLVALAAFAPPLALVVATVHRLLAARHYTLLSSLPPSPDGAVGLATAIRFAAVAARACALPASDVCLALLLLAAPLLVWAWAGVTALALGFTAVGLAVGYALTLVGAVALAALAWRDTLRAGVLVWLPLVLAAAVHSAAAALLPLALTAANVPAAPVVAAAFLGVPSALGLAAATALLAERDWRPTVAPCVAIALAFAGCSATAWSAAAAGVAWGLAAAAQALLILLLLSWAARACRAARTLASSAHFSSPSLLPPPAPPSASALAAVCGQALASPPPPSASLAWRRVRAPHASACSSLLRAAASFPCSNSPSAAPKSR